MPYIGNEPLEGYVRMLRQELTPNGGAVYTLDHPVASSDELEVFVNHVRQRPGDAYTAANTTLTMDGNINATDDFYVIYQGRSVATAAHRPISYVQVQLSTDFILPASQSIVKVPFDTVVFSGGTGTMDFDTDEHVYIAPEAGLYQFNISLQFIMAPGFSRPPEWEVGGYISDDLVLFPALETETFTPLGHYILPFEFQKQTIEVNLRAADRVQLSLDVKDDHSSIAIRSFPHTTVMDVALLNVWPREGT